MATSRDRGPAEQQGDGQPENLHELRDESGGSALADDEKNASGRPGGASGSRGDEEAMSRQRREGQGGSQADGEEVIDAE